MNCNCQLRALGWVVSLLGGTIGAEAQAPAIIPLPQKMEIQAGSFAAGDRTKILVNTGAEETGRYLAGELRRRAWLD